MLYVCSTSYLFGDRSMSLSLSLALKPQVHSICVALPLLRLWRGQIPLYMHRCWTAGLLDLILQYSYTVCSQILGPTVALSQVVACPVFRSNSLAWSNIARAKRWWRPWNSDPAFSMRCPVLFVRDSEPLHRKWHTTFYLPFIVRGTCRWVSQNVISMKSRTASWRFAAYGFVMGVKQSLRTLCSDSHCISWPSCRQGLSFR